MKRISIEQRQANQFCRARGRQVAGALSNEPQKLEVVRIPTTFSSAQEFWTVAVPGSQEHSGFEAYEYLHWVAAPS